MAEEFEASRIFNPVLSLTSDGNEMMSEQEKTETATFAGGCFWCTEAVFERLAGVKKVSSGYTGGHVANPTYAQVCEGDTGHAEGIQIVYDPKVITFEQLLDVHFHTHDPTTLNRQGYDEGTQYRSSVFYHNEKQKTAAKKMIDKLNASGEFDDPIVTKLEELKKWYKAEDYHQEYFRLNPNAGYCRAIIRPKMAKFRARYKALLKKDN